ncbi:MAG: hypothetical protein P8J79_04695 [Halioglobus sp.]|nr:hypothetical protein [Halioglobus sp.]
MSQTTSAVTLQRASGIPFLAAKQGEADAHTSFVLQHWDLKRNTTESQR